MMNKIKKTPYFLYSQGELKAKKDHLFKTCESKNVQTLFPLKSNSTAIALKAIAKDIKGFAVSSLFEAKLAREIGGCEKILSFTSPGLREDEIDQLLEFCDSISFNSLSQWERYRNKAIGKVDCALRINPQISFIDDKRYDPSRKHSRLGIPLSDVKELLKSKPDVFKSIEGLHFHSNCDSEDFKPLLKTVKQLDKHIPQLLEQCSRINLGGGYLFEETSDLWPFEEAVKLLQNKYGLEVIIEPGASIVRDACYLVSSVIDIMTSDGKEIAVLDTTVNHIPEVFEYQYKHDILNEDPKGQYSYVLEGSTCLAGDHFGEYRFSEPLKVGSQIIFTGVGAYSMVKAHTFNGINLPSVYALTEAGDLVLQKQYTYEDFKHKCGATEDNESIRAAVNFKDHSRKQRAA